MTIMHRKYLALEQYHYNYNNSHYNNTNTITTITVGVTAELAVTPTVIVALSAHHALISSPAVNDKEGGRGREREGERGGEERKRR